MNSSAKPSFTAVDSVFGWLGGGGSLWSGVQEPPHESTQHFVVSYQFLPKSLKWLSALLTTTATTTFHGYSGVE